MRLCNNSSSDCNHFHISQVKSYNLEVLKIMEEANAVSNAGISSASCSQDKDTLPNDHCFRKHMGIMTPEEIQVFNTDENKAFFVAISSGDVKKAQSMLDENPLLTMIKIPNGMLPIHMAASHGHCQMLQILFSKTKLDDLNSEEKVHLFFTTLNNNLFEKSLLMLHKYPELAHSRDGEQLTPLHVLARKPKDSFDRPVLDGYERKSARDLIYNLWDLTRSMKHHEMLEFISTPSEVLFDAAKSGNFLISDTILESNEELLMVLDPKKRTLFHIAALYRQPSVIFSPVYEGIVKEVVMQAVDDDGNNSLHMAGMISPHQRFGLSQPDIQMRRELLWFKDVEKRVPSALKFMRNKEGWTPEDIFYRTHQEYMSSANRAMKNKANYGMLIATIIATIVFAASLIVPGHDVHPVNTANFKDPQILQKQEWSWFIVFFVSNSVALFSSSASTICFLTVLTSSYTEDEFNSSLPLRLTSGVTSLFVAITTMLIAFIAACFLIFNHRSTWVAYLVASLGFITVALLVFELYALFCDSIDSLSSSRVVKHHLRPTYYQRLKSRIV